VSGDREVSSRAQRAATVIVAPGASLGGACPKAPVTDLEGHLSIAKFPNETGDYGIEASELRPEHIASDLTGAGRLPRPTSRALA
jgi:hypothetical protein